MTHALDTHTGLPVQTVTAAAVRLDRAATEQHEACAALRSECALLAARPDSARATRLRTPPSTPSASTGPPKIPTLARRLRVLLVEDDEQLARLVLVRLERAGYHVEAVLTGHEACARLRRGWDIIVADLDLGPGCTGVSVLREAALVCPNAARLAWSGALMGIELTRAARGAQAHVAVAKGAGRAPVADLIAAIRGLEVRET